MFNRVVDLAVQNRLLVLIALAVLIYGRVSDTKTES